MITLDIFNSDPFSLANLSLAVTDLKHTPGRIGQLRYFNERPTTTVANGIERVGDQLTLVPDAPRGAPGMVSQRNKAKIVDVRCAHLPQMGAMLADSVQGIRAFGKATPEQLVMDALMPMLKTHRRNIETTLEYHRIGALRGISLDADGVSVLWNAFTLFGLTQQSHALTLNSATAKIRQEVVQAKRKSEDKLGGKVVRSWRAFCGSAFMDALSGNDKIEKSFDRPQDGEFNRSDNRGGFWFADVYWEEYRGTVGGIPFVEANKAILVPEGVDDMFVTLFAPANTMATVNTPGLPFYVTQELLPHGAGVEFKTQSNPLSLNLNPDAVIELTITP